MRRKKAARKAVRKKVVRRVGAKRAARKLARKAVRRKVARKAVRKQVARKAVRKQVVRKAVRKQAVAKVRAAARAKSPAPPAPMAEDGMAEEDEFDSSSAEPLDLFPPDPEEPESGEHDAGKW